MKKIIFFLLIIAIHLGTLGQKKFGVVAGGVLSKTSFKSNDGSRLGFYVGILSDITLSKTLSLRPQLKYIKKGEQNEDGNKGDYYYLELPVNVMANFPTRAGRFSLGGGPALSYMMGGSWVYKDGEKEKISFEYDNVNQFDIGLNLQTGFELPKGLFFTINYTLGFMNVWSADVIGTNKNQAFGIGVGYMF